MFTWWMIAASVMSGTHDSIILLLGDGIDEKANQLSLVEQFSS